MCCTNMNNANITEFVRESVFKYMKYNTVFLNGHFGWQSYVLIIHEDQSCLNKLNVKCWFNLSIYLFKILDIRTKQINSLI